MDSIANMLSQIKNAQAVQKETVEVKYSKINESIAKLLKEEGYLSGVRPFKNKDKGYKVLSLSLKYDESGPVITQLRRISKPGQRVFSKKNEIGEVFNGLGINIISTPRGLMTGKDARKRDLGGEVLCEVW